MRNWSVVLPFLGFLVPVHGCCDVGSDSGWDGDAGHGDGCVGLGGPLLGCVEVRAGG